jgi:hypothetical protein
MRYLGFFLARLDSFKQEKEKIFVKNFQRHLRFYTEITLFAILCENYYSN